MSTFTVTDALGVVLHVNVRVPDPCDVHSMPASSYAFELDGAGETTTTLDDVTPVTLTVFELPDHPDVPSVHVVELWVVAPVTSETWCT